jgi:hypothetical protein
MSTIASPLFTNAHDSDAGSDGLTKVVALDGSADEQIHALEAHVLRQFEAITGLGDATTKLNAFWSIADEILQQSRRLISQHSLAMLGARGRSDLFWNASWPWAEKARSEVGPSSPISVASLCPAMRSDHELRMFNLALATVDHVLWNLASSAFTAPRRDYEAVFDCAYPFRWLDGVPAVVQIDVNPGPDLSQVVFDRVGPYIDPAMSDADRAHLYAENLYYRRIIESDLLQPQEGALIGQWGVFSKQRIPEGTCIGVYGGTLLERESVIMLSDRRYLVKVTTPGMPEYFVSGDNVTSLMNSMFLFDEKGRVAAQDTRHHNVRPHAFRCKTTTGIVFSLIAFFASHEIEPDTELRWSYGYDDVALVRNKLRD